MPSSSAQPTGAPIALPHSLAGSGAMAALVYAKDWSQTPLGPLDQWPQSLRTTVSLCLASNFPINIIWGPQRVQMYNDGYWPLCGDKHPASMGQDYRECWRSAWEVLGDAFDKALAGQTQFLENQRMFLDRYGYLEETFFTFSFSPILDESGGVGGLFHPVTELTQQTLAERRLNILRTLAERTGTTQTVREAAARVLETLGDFDFDLPFVLLYSLAPGAQQAQLEGSVGVAAAPLLAPSTLNLDLGPAESGWPLAAVARQGQAQPVEALGTVFGSFTSGPYPEPPTTALVFPLYLASSGSEARPAYFLVMGVSARRALDAEYTLFFDLLAGAVNSALSKARALEDERNRVEALAELDRAKTAFFSNISHEFRTPLTLMLGPLEDSLTDTANPLPAPQYERLMLVQRNTLRLQRLVNSLLDFSRLEAGRLQASFEPTDLAAYTSELASVFRAAMEKAGLAYEVDCPTLATPVYVDPVLWEKVVFNLLSNALKFTFQGSVSVRLREEAGEAVLQVRDTGEGISATALPKLFTRFYRSEGTRSRTHEGSGIGLALVQELVKLHGGTIAVASKPGQGTTFTVRLPTGMAHLPADQVQTARPAALRPHYAAAFLEEAQQWLAETPLTSAAAEPEPEEDATREMAATILVVDDNADMRAYVQRILAQRPNWTIHTAADGQHALEAVELHKPDLVLSDVMMPRLDGFGLLHALKQHPEMANVPVVLLSARAGEEATVEGLNQGADDYLIKPFSARELLARVRTQLDITRTRQDNTMLRTAETQLQHLNEEMAFRNQELQAVNHRLMRTNVDLDTFVYTASHDLKAPITNIESILLALRDTLPATVQQDEVVAHLLEMFNTTVARFRFTIGQLTDISRLQLAHAGPAELVALAQAIENVRLDLVPAIAAAGTQLTIEVAPDLVVSFSPANLRSIIYNLLSNAIKYRAAERPSQVLVRAAQTDAAIVLTVQDNGLGMSELQQRQLFGLFQRLHTHVEGTGVGLYISKRLVENAGGTITVQSQADAGATFTVTFPA